MTDRGVATGYIIPLHTMSGFSKDGQFLIRTAAPAPERTLPYFPSYRSLHSPNTAYHNCVPRAVRQLPAALSLRDVPVVVSRFLP